jgi:hypothetical protein
MKYSKINLQITSEEPFLPTKWRNYYLPQKSFKSPRWLQSNPWKDPHPISQHIVQLGTAFFRMK